MTAIIESIKKDLNVNSITISVLRKLADESGLYLNEFVSYNGKSKAVLYGVKKSPTSKGHVIVGTAKECAEYMASEI